MEIFSTIKEKRKLVERLSHEVSRPEMSGLKVQKPKRDKNKKTIL